MPHRPLFGAAAMLWPVAGLWWYLRLRGGQTTLLPAAALHGLLMGLGVIPLFIAGFAFTTLPRWLGLPAQSARGLWAPAAGIWLAWCALLLADGLGLRLVAALAALLIGLLLAGLALRLLLLCRLPAARFSPHALGLIAGLAWIGLSQMLAALAIGLDRLLLLQVAARLGLCLGVAGVFALALQRLTPFLHQQGRRAPALFAALLTGLAARSGLELAGLSGRRPSAGLAAIAAIGFAALALLLWRDARRPELAAARRTPLVAQLYIGYLWLGLSFALEAWAQAAAALGLGSELGLGLAPLHALSLGFMGGTLLAMVSRVTAVQQGRSVAVDAWLWVLQALLQALTLARLFGAIWPAAAGFLLPYAAAGFALLGLGWAGRYLPWLLRRPAARMPP
ncbi:NnrS family protein [Roseateles oligotrophus]|uniref:NnrS family protein n=1 Tax=Roseateles oligotrophus TaxID=1769250 RepID=A0ABT2YEG5_9BURK|nr:NnrS family protein [Roseateles oligotrophus]MCV2368451.1 NnrS family protein [Roseateles oligotrophus]